MLLFLGTRLVGGVVSVVGGILLPLAIVALLTYSLWRVRRAG